MPDGGWLLAVADGMGGHAGGAVAAEIAVACLAKLIPPRRASLAEAFVAACRAMDVRAAGEPELAHMGTTLTAAVAQEGRLTWCHLGDSRLYLWRQGSLSQVTRDDTVVQELLDSGSLNREEARVHPTRHLLYECLGCGDCQPACGEEPLHPGDLVLLTSDGLHGELPNRDLAAVLAGEGAPADKTARLVSQALEAGGRDNVTAVLLEW
ncbi:MAG: protein phosphatase 2C domain-containing protein [Deltaproteobacteria bacterium]|nr:protein phosphatase 2C domain-containing protein [Deltaproteobacteria bacterium]